MMFGLFSVTVVFDLPLTDYFSKTEKVEPQKLAVQRFQIRWYGPIKPKISVVLGNFLFSQEVDILIPAGC